MCIRDRLYSDFKFLVFTLILFPISIIDPMIGSISRGRFACKSCVVEGLWPFIEIAALIL